MRCTFAKLLLNPILSTSGWPRTAFFFLFFLLNFLVGFGQQGVEISSSEPDPTTANPIPIEIKFEDGVDELTIENFFVQNGEIQNLQRGVPGFENYESQFISNFNVKADLWDYLLQGSPPIDEYINSKIKNLIVAIDITSEGELIYLTYKNGVYKAGDNQPLISGNQFATPLDLVIDNNDRIIVTDPENYRIRIYNQNGNYLYDIGGSQGKDGNEFYGPSGLAVNGENLLFVADAFTGNDPEGLDQIKIYHVGENSATFDRRYGDQVLDDPYRIAVDRTNNVYVSDAGGDSDSGRVVVFNNSDEVEKIIANSANDSPGSIIVDDLGYLYMVNYFGDLKFTDIYQNPDVLLSQFEELQNATYQIDVFDPLPSLEKVTSVSQNLNLPVDLSLNNCDFLYALNMEFEGEVSGNLDGYPTNIDVDFNFNVEKFKRQDNFTAEMVPEGPGLVEVELSEIDLFKCGQQPEGEFFINYETGDPEPTFSCPEEGEIPPLALDENCNYVEEDLDYLLNEFKNFKNDPHFDQTISRNDDFLSVNIKVYDGEYGDFVGECVFDIELEDTIAPYISCPEDIERLISADEDFAVVDFQEPDFFDNCSGAVIEQSGGLPSGSEFDVGTHTIEFTVTDSSGNKDACSFKITVEQEPPPSAPQFENCPDETITVSNDPGECGAIVEFEEPTAFDDSGELGVELISDLGLGDFFPLGTTEVVFEATGENGQTVTCSFEVLVKDEETPQITCPEEDMEIEIGISENSAIVEFGDPVVSDNCGEVTWEQTSGPASGEYFTEGTTTVEFTATDEAGNKARCFFTVRIFREDEEPSPDPEFTCPTDEEIPDIVLDENCEYDIPDLTNLIETDNFTPRFEQNQEKYGSSVLVTIDIFNDDEPVGECSFSVSLVDETAPEITCPADISVEIPAGSESTVVDYDTPVVSDNCSDEFNLTRLSGPAPGSELEAGIYEVEYRVEDESGNTSSCSFTITLTSGDQENLEFECVNAELILDENGYASINAEDLYAGQENGWNFSLDQDEFNCSDLGTRALVLTAVDPETGATGTCTLNLEIIDDIPPVVQCVDNSTLTLNANGTASLSAEDLNFQSSDNCGIEAMEIDKTEFTRNDLGENIVTLTLSDTSGNTDSCEVSVSVEEVEEPLPDFDCREEIRVELDENGEGQLTISDFYTGSTAGHELEVSQLEFTCADLGENQIQVNWSGETSGSCEVLVVVEDQTPPVVQAEDLSVVLDNNGRAEVSPQDVDQGSFDNCGEVDFNLSQSVFTCEDVGENFIDFTVTDESGNSTTSNVRIFVNANPGTCSEIPAEGTDYIFIYPNPSSGNFTTATPAGIVIDRIVIFDKRGRYLLERDFPKNATEYQMNLSGVSEAVYVLRIFTNEGEFIRRLLIRK